MSSSNPLLDDIQSDWEALQREKTKFATARKVAKLFPTPSNAQSDLAPQWAPSHYELFYLAETCENCGDIQIISSSIFYVERSLRASSTVQKSRVDPRHPDFIPGLSRKIERQFCTAPACPDCLNDILFAGYKDNT